MRTEKAMVLVSGGLDSVAAMHFARGAFEEVAAIAFDYGQPNRDAELYASQSEAEALGVPWERVYAADAFPRAGLLAKVHDHDAARTGVDRAFVPGRNGIMLWIAAGRAAVRWPVGNLALVIGANAEDAAGFPDCHPRALLKIGESMRHALARQIEIVTPWIVCTKAQILAAVDESGRAACARSWSCYRGDGPCGACSACVKRAAAFSATGFVDACKPPKMHGGDPARERR